MAEDKLTENQKKFCSEYIYDWNGTRAYRLAYPDCKTDNSAAVCAVKLLRIAKIKKHIVEIQKDIEKRVGISREMVAKEHMKLAFSSIAHLHNTWVTRKEFEDLTDEQKACISEISTQIKTTRNVSGELTENEYVKVKLYDKQKSLDSIAKMLGYNEPDKIEIPGISSIKLKEL